MSRLRCFSPAAEGGRRAADCGGFTLIELIIVIVLIGLLSAVGTTMISDSFDTSQMVNASEASNARARYAMERLERELREIKYAVAADPCSDGSSNRYCIITPTGTALPTATPLSVSGASTFSFNKIDGTTATVANSSAALSLNGVELCGNVQGLTLAFYGGDGTTEPSKASVRLALITLTVRDGTSGRELKQQTRITFRNSSS